MLRFRKRKTEERKDTMEPLTLQSFLTAQGYPPTSAPTTPLLEPTSVAEVRIASTLRLAAPEPEPEPEPEPSDSDDENAEFGDAIASYILQEQLTHKDFYFHTGDGEPTRLRIRETSTGFLHGGTGGWVWNSSVYLARWLCLGNERRAAVRKRIVLELGCGSSAVPSLVAAHLGATAVIATDVCPECVAAAQESVRDAQLSSQVSVSTLDATKLTYESLQLLGPPAETILFADLVYLVEVASALPATLALLLRRCPDKDAGVCYGCVAERTLVGGGAATAVFLQGLDDAGLYYKRSALPAAVEVDGGVYDAADSPYLYEIRLRNGTTSPTEADQKKALLHNRIEGVLRSSEEALRLRRSAGKSSTMP